MARPGARCSNPVRAGLTHRAVWWSTRLTAFPAFDALNKVDPHPQWEALTTSGLRLVEIARFGRWGLPPDWLLLVNPLEPSPQHPPATGWMPCAFRCTRWAKRADAQRLAPFQKFWTQFKCDTFLPAWANLQDHSIDSLGAEAGLTAIRNRLPPAKPLPTAPP